MITCIDCGVQVERRGSNHKRCRDCAIAHRSIYTSEYRRRMRAVQQARMGPPMLTCVDCDRRVERASNRQERCRGCGVAYRRRRKAEYDSRPESLERARLRRKRNDTPEKRRAARERSRKWYADNPERVEEYRRRYATENSEALREYRARYYRENRDAYRRSWKRKAERDASVDASRGGQPWTDAEDAVVVSWTGSLRELGTVLGRTSQSVRHRGRLLRQRAHQSV